MTILSFTDASIDRLSADRARDLVDAELTGMMAQAAHLRDVGHGDVVSVSKKVFIPLTHFCRDVCHYCTFARRPRVASRMFMTPDDVLAAARAGAAAGCKEALFTLGDKPELRYRAAHDALKRLGHDSTIGYLATMAELVFRETGLFPHINAGVMTKIEITDLRGVSVSQGLMLESVSERLCKAGGPHHGSPDKAPQARLRCIEAAGEQAVPFTSGLLIGIGETRQERIDTLLALRELDDRFGHIQEIILQPFRAKAGTKMAAAPEPPIDELLWTIAATRLLFGPAMNIQTPPNLMPDGLGSQMAAGINDWGGVSPVTPDFVNPEAPWPHLDALAAKTAASHKVLTERLAIYPTYALAADRWVDPSLRPRLRSAIDADGLARTDGWTPGEAAVIPDIAHHSPIVRCRRRSVASIDRILARAESGGPLTHNDIVRLFRARGGEVGAIVAAADSLRDRTVGPTIGYVINRNINYTNICTYHCMFCAFSKGRIGRSGRDDPYRLDFDEIARRAAEAQAQGATEVCLQGGIHPNYDGSTYLEICRTVAAAAPGIHIHAFSPLEITHGADTLGLPVSRFLDRLKAAGLGSLPGTAAEILVDEVRNVICPDKLSAQDWMSVIRAAHVSGLPTTSTIMFGHVDGPADWATHLTSIRELQCETGGLTEFVPLPFVARDAPIYLAGKSRRGPTFREAVLMHAVARLSFHPVLANIQVSWPKLGLEGAAICLRSGANDFGGTLMNESITRAAGGVHGQNVTPVQFAAIARSLGRSAVQRTTLYTRPSPPGRPEIGSSGICASSCSQPGLQT